MENAISLTFGRRGACQIQIPADNLKCQFHAPTPVKSISEDLAHGLESPLNYPCLRQAVVPGDQIVLVVDRQTPQAESLILGVWTKLEASGVSAEDVTILVPAAITPSGNPDLRRLLPAEVREKVALKTHDPTDEKSLGYLATTTGGERIYLNQDLLNADLPILIGGVGFDPVLGFRGGGSAIYPGLSSVDAIRKSNRAASEAGANLFLACGGGCHRTLGRSTAATTHRQVPCNVNPQVLAAPPAPPSCILTAPVIRRSAQSRCNRYPQVQ